MSVSDVFNSLFQPVADLTTNLFSRKCNELCDDHFVELGVLRVLSDYRSGREFLQIANLDEITNVSNSHLFKIIKKQTQIKSFSSNRKQSC
jgi:hypothetical protein